MTEEEGLKRESELGEGRERKEKDEKMKTWRE